MKQAHKAAMLAIIPALLALGFFLVPGQAHACKCGPPGSPGEEFGAATSVFMGEVVSVQGATDEGGPSDDPQTPRLLVRFLVGTVWKGGPDQAMFVTTSRWAPSCGVDFTVGRDYVVYASTDAALPREAPPAAHRCGRTKRAHEAGEDLEWLGEGTAAPVPGSMSSTPAQPAPDRTAPGGCGAPPYSPDSRDTWALGPAALTALLGVLGVRRRPGKQGACPQHGDRRAGLPAQSGEDCRDRSPAGDPEAKPPESGTLKGSRSVGATRSPGPSCPSPTGRGRAERSPPASTTTRSKDASGYLTAAGPRGPSTGT